MRWRGGLPLRSTMMLVIVLGVTAPALLLLAAEQKLTEQSQRTQQEYAEKALMGMGGVSLADPIWVVDRNAINDVASHLLENPQVVAVRVEDRLSSAPPVERVRDGYTLSLDAETAAQRLNRRTQTVARVGEPLGTLTVWFDMTHGRGLLQQRRNQMLMLVAVQVIASLLMLTPVLVARILMPIERLKEQATALLDHGDGDEPPVFVWTRRDELGLLGRHLGKVQIQLRELFGQLEAKNKLLEQLAMYDHLTGLPNRALFTDLVQREMLLERRGRQRFGVFFIDLDRFKAVNDSMGHAAGDALLVEVGHRLQATLRELDVVCRQSGDEFLVLVRDIEHWELLADMAQRLLKVIEVPVPLHGGATRISASIGIALFPDDADNFETLVKNADVAMYQAKALGRARYSFFHAGLNDRLQSNMELERQFGQAIVAGELVLHYQPQVDAITGALTGVEALVRWQHPQRGLLYPAHFIGMAEETGKIAEMGVWTLGEACRQMAQWKASGIHVGCMSVNVSSLEFRDHRLIDSVQAALSASGIAPAELEIEITESVLMAETDTSQRIIEHLREIGVGIAIDDFGTGYSSLSYLKRLHPNQLKIDQSFVSDASTDNDSKAIIQGVVGLANALSLSVVAEGVETSDQLQFLRASGCHILQGYYIARPLSVDQLEAWVAQRDLALFA
jgi:diguanylate cyclase (GGDEF)-like protein